jgi:hypothetical protein
MFYRRLLTAVGAAVLLTGCPDGIDDGTDASAVCWAPEGTGVKLVEPVAQGKKPLIPKHPDLVRGLRYERPIREALRASKFKGDEDRAVAALMAIGAIETGNEPWKIGDSGKAKTMWQLHCMDPVRPMAEDESTFDWEGHRALLRRHFGKDFTCASLITTQAKFEALTEDQQVAHVRRQAEAALVVLKRLMHGHPEYDWALANIVWNKPQTRRAGRAMHEDARRR